MSERLPALLATLHDPQGRMHPALEGRGAALAPAGGRYAAVYVTATDATSCELASRSVTVTRWPAKAPNRPASGAPR